MCFATVSAAATAAVDLPPNPGEAPPGVRRLATPRRAVGGHQDTRRGLPDADTSTDRSRNRGEAVPSGPDPAAEGACE